ncbi:hypothetical protein A2210_00580 [Candidatus Woesebacteria bacterium RIFOXYA1_FULL_40_18]|uniref:PPM-type phosphatase domain-containing protein n=3 Tax=Candidatus Woeseibacteriota TaxID=1752722 RepID=A0A1F8CKD9_9BACT|nr:MAG: hypothetical protein A2210_00580 [Candidatus Woesebacteria bacterium RIFOXYA1_FULL_40_18]OGM80207.1 MAG: hypothetical protein A2361_00825 [Candidatus Woesebacteria bacterium RIFOXYB1_FULL_40_26]OGM87249.1 MAG: hypothetical protein A2614_02420 [Candidatus Woesebacteria bacterium RIFOXYD1_FULL_40_21]
MEFKLASAKLTGNPGTSGWAQVYEFKPEEGDKLSKRGHLFAVVATKKGDGEVDNLVTGREIIARLHEEYFGNLEGGAFNTLKSAVSKVVEEFKSTLGDIEIAAVASLGEVVYTAVGEGGQIAILRNGMLANILVGSPGVVSASGYPKLGDVLLVGTKSFFEIFPSEVVKANLEAGEPEAVIESFAPSVHAKEDAGGVGVIVLKFGGEEIAEAREVGPSLFSRLRSVVKLPHINFPERKIYIKRDEGDMDDGSPPQGRKVMVSAGAILLVLLIVSIGFGIRQNRIRKERSQYEPKLVQAQHNLDEAEALLTLNPQRARELFSESLTIARSLQETKVKDARVDELVKKLDGRRGAILGEYNEGANDFLDLSLQTSGFNGDELASSGEKVFILDKGGKRVISVAIDTKRTTLVAGPSQIPQASGLAAYEDRTFVLEDEGIYEVGEKNTKVIDKDWSGEILLYAYAGNFYVLDKSAGTIWRYPGSPAGEGTNFGTRQKWLGPGISPSFSGATSMTIDGAVWVLGRDATVQKFSLGSPQKFSISGVFPEILSTDSIYTNEELKFVYILDKSQGKIVVLEKDGNYKAQYFSDKLKEAKDIAVSEKNKKIIFLLGSKLYSIEIKHL